MLSIYVAFSFEIFKKHFLVFLENLRIRERVRLLSANYREILRFYYGWSLGIFARHVADTGLREDP